MQIQILQARNQTERQLAVITREILASYEDARKDINREIQKLFSRTLEGVSPDDYYNVAIQGERLKSLQAQIDTLYVNASVKAGRKTVSASTLAMDNAYYKNQYIAEHFAPVAGVDLSFTAMPPELLELSVTGNIDRWNALEADLKKGIQAKYGNIQEYVPKSGSTLSALLVTNRRAEVLKINRAISSGLLQGKGYRDIARAVSKVIGSVSKDGAKGAMASALRIVRTESNRTYNDGAYAEAQVAADAGLEVKRIWNAALDKKTRPQSISMDGQTVGKDEPFTYPDGSTSMKPGNSGNPAYDINERCTVINAVDGIPPKARLGVNPATGEYEVFDWQSYPEWAESNGLKELPNGRWA